MLSALLKRYEEASRSVYEAWKLDIPDPCLPSRFQFEYLAEPYLYFSSQKGMNASPLELKSLACLRQDDFCVFLTTNPGGGMPVQLKEGVKGLSGGCVPTEYHPLAGRMAIHYQAELKGAAGANIKKMKSIATALLRAVVLQVEMVPWHSSNLPNKARLLEELSRCTLFMNYRCALEDLIRACPVVLSWSAGVPALRGGDGVDFKANAMGLFPKSAECLEISKTKRGVSQALLWKKDRIGVKGMFVRQGSANLPANKEIRLGIKLFNEIAQTLIG